VMYCLSPTSLNLYLNCPRCFWLAIVKNVKRPSSPMSSIPIKMDSIIKNYFDRYRAVGELPPILRGQVTGRLTQGMPTTLRHEEENGILLWGRPDDYFEFEDGATVPFDHKTRSGPPGDIHPAYKLQMSVYSYLLRLNGYKTADNALFGFYFPDESDLHIGMRIRCMVVKVATDPDGVKNLVTRACDVLHGSMPEAAENCRYCSWNEEIQKLLPPTSPLIKETEG